MGATIDRRAFVETVAAGMAALIAPGTIHAQDRQSRRKPNILLILADDLGWGDVGYQSQGRFVTPNIDRLAREGAVFTNAYACAANCAPSRACLLSGAYTPRHGVYAVDATDRGPRDQMRMVPIPNTPGLNTSFVTMAEALRGAGYATGHFGKWHLTGGPGTLPSEQGFDVTHDSFGDGPVTEGSEQNLPGPETDPKGVFTLTRKAVQFMAANRERPFFCYLAHHAIHGPLQARTSTRVRMEQHAREAGVSSEYMGCTYDFDDSIGRLLADLKQLGLEENTLVVFTSDNGALRAQEPLRGSKGCYYEGGIREPFIVRWPGVVRPRTVCEAPIALVDLYPTFLAAAGVVPHAGTKLDGVSLVPLLQRRGGLRRTSIYWHFPGYLDRPVSRGRDPVFRTRPVSVIRKGDWKLFLYHEEWQLDGGRDALASNNAVELYDLGHEVGERDNLALRNPAKRDELLGDLLRWMTRVQAPMPTKRNPGYRPATGAAKAPERPRWRT
jgi:arylsulfatase A-like enzyme